MQGRILKGFTAFAEADFVISPFSLSRQAASSNKFFAPVAMGDPFKALGNFHRLFPIRKSFSPFYGKSFSRNLRILQGERYFFVNCLLLPQISVNAPRLPGQPPHSGSCGHKMPLFPKSVGQKCKARARYNAGVLMWLACRSLSGKTVNRKQRAGHSQPIYRGAHDPAGITRAFAAGIQPRERFAFGIILSGNPHRA